MEKNQFDLCLEILRRLSKERLLEKMILIGSWCVPFYESYFAPVKYSFGIRTRDIDFLVPEPHKMTANVDIPELLKDLGFVVGYYGAEGYIKLEHPELVVEFLSPERGRGTDKPILLPGLGVNAAALPFLTLLTENIITVKVADFCIRLPHPVNFALHKLIVFQRRTKEEKAEKDRRAAIEILNALIEKGESSLIKRAFDSMIPAWQKKVLKGVREIGGRDILHVLGQG